MHEKGSAFCYGRHYLFHIKTTSYIDYKDKEVGIKKVFMPTGDVEKDMRMIKSYYKSFHARRPENFVTGL